MSKTIVTHNSSYHADDVFAVAALKIAFPDSSVIRSRDSEAIAGADIVVDTGSVYDPAKMRFDHHQPDGAGKRENGIPYASFGLVWKEFGEKISGSAEAARIIDEKLCMPIDAIDNGFDISKPTVDGVKEYSVRDLFYSYTSVQSSEEEIDAAFEVVVGIARELLMREIRLAQEDVRDWRDSLAAYDSSEDKRVVLLPRTMSWKKALIPTEALVVVYPRPDGKWGARMVPDKLNSFGLKKPFPESWAGKRDEELALVSGVADARFCHNKLWLAVASSKEGAIELAQKALNA